MTAGAASPSSSRLVFAIIPLVILAGVLAWQSMPRQEDPSFPARFGSMVVFFPGAEAEDMERLVATPLEESLAQVDEIRHVETTLRTGFALFYIELREEIYDTHYAWDEVREAIEKARDDLPDGATEPVLADDLVQQESMVFAVTGSGDPLVLREGARKLRRRLLRVEGVARITTIADPEEQVTIEYDEAAARRVGINQRVLAAQLASRSSAVPGGTIRVGDQRATLSADADFGSVEEIERTPIVLASGSAVELGELATVRRGPKEPAQDLMRHDGQLSIGLGVIPRDSMHLTDLGERVRAAVDGMRGELEPLEIREVSFQPEYVSDRLMGLGASLLLSILLVGAVLFFFMGTRSAIVVTSMVPLVAMGALAIFWIGGGILHQMSIAAFVIALGMLVDNAIVVVENIQARIDGGADRTEAAAEAVRELRVPLSVATATTVAAFLPMLLAAGTTADFIRALPVVIMLALVLSLVAALVVTPMMCAYLLGPRRASEGGLEDLAQEIGSLGVRKHRSVLVVAVGLMLLTAAGMPLVEQRFFPPADRNQVVITLQLREGTHLTRTDTVAQQLEEMLRSRDDVLAVSTFVGRGVPRFYYNLATEPNAPHVAQILVATRHFDDNEPLATSVRDFLARNLPEVQATARPLEQGPHVRAPVEVRLYGEDPREVAVASDTVLRILKSIGGTVDVFSDVDLGAPTVQVGVVDASAGRRGVSRTDVALALLAQSRGLEVGEYRGGDTSVPIVLRSRAGENTGMDRLAALGVSAPQGGMIPLGQLATRDIALRPAAIYHRDGRRITRVLAGLAEDVSFDPVLEELEEGLAAEPLPAGVTIELGGAAEGAGDANAAMLEVFPIGLALILICLLWEFRSFRRVGIVLATVPLSGVGIIPGLIVSGEPFGFMSLLGVIALAGIVVNNAIVLMDVVERNRAEGMSRDAALAAAARVRTRPILLTTATTVAGLLPLAFSSSTLWPPLAWAMISGLLASTFLTLLAVPALYRQLIPDDRPGTGGSHFRHSDGLSKLPADLDPLDDEDGPTVIEGLSRPRPAASAGPRLFEARGVVTAGTGRGGPLGDRD